MHCREPPSGLAKLSVRQSPIETRRPFTRFRIWGLQVLHTPWSIFNSMCTVQKMLCTGSISHNRANSTPCQHWTLAATFLLPHRHPDYFCSIPAPVRFLTRNGGSSCLHIGKYVIEVLEVFHNKRSNTRHPFHLHIAILTLGAFHWDIVHEYFCDCSELSWYTSLRYSDTCWFWISSSQY